jgi:DNA-directed RNA polymerase subunit H (RpoH/RPB5)
VGRALHHNVKEGRIITEEEEEVRGKYWLRTEGCPEHTIIDRAETEFILWIGVFL